MNCIKNGLKILPASLRRRLDPDLKVMFEVGYINEQLERTHDGIHTILNFIEQDSDLSPKFIAYLKALRAEKVAEAKEKEAGE